MDVHIDGLLSDTLYVDGLSSDTQYVNGLSTDTLFDIDGGRTATLFNVDSLLNNPLQRRRSLE